jgi:ABC-2 type transport system permease protein
MKIKTGLVIAKTSFQEASAYRAFLIFSIISNLVYTIVVYFLWKAIYSSAEADVINGMTFEQTFVYLSLAGAMSLIINSFIEWFLSREIKTGNITRYFTRPVDFQFQIYSKTLGDIITNFLIIFIPSFIIAYIFSSGGINLGLNILFFIISFVFAALINITIDFLIGLICFYTESVWGISIMKETIVLLLSGGVIPLAFFPDKLRHIVEFLPFQAIYNLPMQILTNKSFTLADYGKALLVQIFWVAVLIVFSRICCKQAVKVVVINGG